MTRCTCPICIAAHENRLGRNDDMIVIVRLDEDE